MVARERYTGLTEDQFDGILEGIVDGMTGAQILAISGVYDVLREELNNDVLALWEQDHPEDSDDVWDEGAPKVGDLVFNPSAQTVALQSPYGIVEQVNGREGISTFNVDLEDGDTVSIEFYDSAWHLSDEYADTDQE